MDAYSRRVYLARVRDFVGDATFPATRAQLLRHAERRNTPGDILRDLNRLAADQFASLDEVVAAIDVLRFGAASR